MSQIVVAIPGPWRDRSELMQALARVDRDHMFAYRTFFEQSTNTSCEFDLYPHEPELRGTFEISGQGRFSREELDLLGSYASAACLTFDDPGYENARTAARFAKVLLEAGGFAVKVDSGGVAHTRERWLRDWDSDDPWTIYSLFVVLVGGDGLVYSCGMHNFALPDAAVPESLGDEAGIQLLNVFNVYQLTESPELATGHTFSADADAPRFRLRHGPYADGYDPESPLYNPYGMWSLEPADPPPPRRRWSFRRR
ncbi:MAG TPA: hypothetical protein VF092_22280 [Longimicrobium sp.]